MKILVLKGYLPTCPLFVSSVEYLQMEETAQHPKNGKTRHIKTAGVILIVLAFGFLLGLWLTSFGGTITIPDSVTQSTKSAIYIPSKLPGNYTLDETSFSIQEGEVLLFRATDGAGGRIAFTQQPSPPADFDFQNFYKEQLQDPKTLSNVPFPSVVGKALNQETIMISIVTPETWVIASTSSPLSNEDMQVLAKYLKRHDK